MGRDSNPNRMPLEGASWRDGLAFSAVVLAAAVLYPLLDGQPLFWDEYYHLLAGRSWAADGALAVGDGIYERAGWLSIGVGLVFRLVGPEVLAARLTIGVVTAAWGVLLFIWTYRLAGRGSAWATGLLFGLSPLVLVNSGMIRFYGIVGVLILITAIAAMLVGTGHARGTQLLFAVLAGLGAGYLAYRITSLTRIWLAGLGVWVVGSLLVRLSRTVGWRWPLILGSGVLAVLLGVMWWTGWLHATWETYRAVPAWGAPRQNDLRWYEGLLRADYPTLWTLLPVAALVAVRRVPALASMAITVFVTGLFLLSGAGPKAERYLLPILPFFFLVWGISVPALLSALGACSHQAFERLPDLVWGGRIRKASVVLSLTVAGGFVLGTNPGFSRVRTIASGAVRSVDRPLQGAGASPHAWDEVAQQLRGEMQDVGVVVTANSLQALFHIGDYDFAMRPTVVGELSPPADFGLDPRTGRPGIGSLTALQRLVAEHRTGVIFGERWRWGHEIEGFAPEVEDYVLEHMTEVDLPPDAGIRAFRWVGAPVG